MVETTDVTQYVELQEELEESEELHRTVLSNMTETIFITNEEGEFTYICPNVHFIFGYTADEVNDMGTVDELLGADLFSKEKLRENGVLTNIEVEVTNKGGAEKTLLLNVREVDIQDGNILYSARDVTKRKRREESLASLHQASRELLHAETHKEISQVTVEKSIEILDFEVAVFYHYSEKENELQPIAYSSGAENLHGPLSSLSVQEDSLPAEAFVESTPLYLTNIHENPKLQNQATEVRSAAYIPLSEHGVFFVGTTEKDALNEVNQELADLTAATAEAALDRVKRESELREADRKLQKRNARLEQLNQINEIIREIDQAVIRADSRKEIEETVCTKLTDESRFSFAWIGRVDHEAKRLTPTAWAGDSKGYLDTLSLDLESGDEDLSI
ncbi:MAG: PAS domain S-box protein, partial [Halobacteriaceae archaeon]